MKKKILKIVGTVVLIGIIGFSFINFYSFGKVSEELAIKKGIIKFPQKYEIYQTTKCDNFNIINPKYAFVNKWTDRSDYEVMFYKVKTKTLFSQKYNFEYLGGTTISNTTFPQLLKMVKEDCSQFQEKHYESDEKIRWSYSKAETKEEKEKRDKRNKKEDEEFKEKFWIFR